MNWFSSAKNTTLAIATSDLRLGFKYKNEGIFLGPWSPQDRDGTSLKQTFYVFAAPTDLDSSLYFRTFANATRKIDRRIMRWHGHKGIHIDDDVALFNGLRDGSALGRWFIPPCELLNGKKRYGVAVLDTHLYLLKDVGDFQNTVITTPTHQSASEHVWPDCYWSCTRQAESPSQAQAEDPSRVMEVRMSSGTYGWREIADIAASTRPMRVIRAPNNIRSPGQ